MKDQIQRLTPLAEDNLIAFSADMWSSKSTKEKFIDLSVHYLDENFGTMKSEQLKMEPFPENHSHENIISRFDPISSELKQDPNKAVFVTDSPR